MAMDKLIQDSGSVVFFVHEINCALCTPGNLNLNYLKDGLGRLHFDVPPSKTPVS
ncbi:hypothetical protein METHB2_290002 [Candidatus Methylobacter favarea]|uniref:Uncharacterized protein n=1 Tax=Candidatus Methylobacter favarea TaxID=2707345 RepID=A0A8S0WP56_9GAMM|nr:hypothetical protein METHB2_290002 [Candidatus Methylobacter favarea]